MAIFNVKNVAIIGAGPSGLAAAKYLVAEGFEVQIFEQQAEVGGVWNYTKGSRTAQDYESPMYDQLITNIPKEMMRFTDQSFPDCEVFPNRQTVLDYLIEYSQNVRHLISFSTLVQSVKSREGKWLIATHEKEEIYNAVVVASGHYDIPWMPDIPGLQEWQGLVMHSKQFDSPTQFEGKKVIVVGNAASGVDIGHQLSAVAQVLFSVKSVSDMLTGDTIDVPPIEKICEGDIIFEGGMVEKDVDCIIFCTGYLYSFPFLDELQHLLISDGLRTQHLYKHLFFIDNPTMVFMALPQRIIPFPVAEAEAAVFARVWANRISLPSREEMCRWEMEVLLEKGAGKRFHVLGHPADQEYINELYSWSMSAGNAGKEPPMWGGEHHWIRTILFEARRAFVESGRKAKSLEELGFRYEQHLRDEELAASISML